MPAPMHLDLSLESLWSHGRALYSTVAASDWWFRKVTLEVRQSWGRGDMRNGALAQTLVTTNYSPSQLPLLLVLLGCSAGNRQLTHPSPPTPLNSATQ